MRSARVFVALALASCAVAGCFSSSSTPSTADAGTDDSSAPDATLPDDAMPAPEAAAAADAPVDQSQPTSGDAGADAAFGDSGDAAVEGAAADASTDADATVQPVDAGIDAGNDASPEAAAGSFPIFRLSPNVDGGSPVADCELGVTTAAISAMSTDGGFVAFACLGTDQTSPQPTGTGFRVYMRDVGQGTTQEVSVTADGGDLYNPYTSAGEPFAVSGDGRYAVFSAIADYWDPATYPSNTALTLVLRDLTHGTSTLVGKATNGTLYGGSELSLSSDGRYLSFIGASSIQSLPYNSNTSQVWVRDLTQNGDALTVASVTTGALDGGAEGGGVPQDTSFCTGGSTLTDSMSADGRLVAFESCAPLFQLGAADAGAPTYQRHCFVRDMVAQTTSRIDVAASGVGTTADWPDGECDAPIVAAGGRYVAFYSYATNLVAGDTNGLPDIFVRDLLDGTTEAIDVDGNGALLAGVDAQVLESDFGISADGNYVVFASNSKSIVPNDLATSNREVFVRDRAAGRTLRASFQTDGAPLTSGMDTGFAAISGDGTLVAFTGSGAGLFPDKTNSAREVVGVPRAAAR